jgi:hypothetical protein
VRALIERDAEIERWLREEVVPGHLEHLAEPSKAIPAEDLLGRIKARQLGRDARLLRMDLGVDMVRHQTHDPLAVGGGHRPAAVFQPARQSVDPVPAVWVEHHLDDGGVLEEGRDPGPSAVRRMCAPREKASEWSGVTATIVPVEGQSRRANGDEDD